MGTMVGRDAGKIFENRRANFIVARRRAVFRH